VFALDGHTSLLVLLYCLTQAVLLSYHIAAVHHRVQLQLRSGGVEDQDHGRCSKNLVAGFARTTH